MNLITASLRVVWSVAYVLLIALAALAMPVTCRCGDQVPGPRALVVAADQIPALDPRVNYGSIIQTPAEHQQSERPALTELPTTLEFGVAAVALTLIIGAGLTLPRPTPPVAIVQFMLGLMTAPKTPPPRFSSVAL